MYIEPLSASGVYSLTKYLSNAGPQKLSRAVPSASRRQPRPLAPHTRRVPVEQGCAPARRYLPAVSCRNLASHPSKTISKKGLGGPGSHLFPAGVGVGGVKSPGISSSPFLSPPPSPSLLFSFSSSPERVAVLSLMTFANSWVSFSDPPSRAVARAEGKGRPGGPPWQPALPQMARPFCHVLALGGSGGGGGQRREAQEEKQPSRCGGGGRALSAWVLRLVETIGGRMSLRHGGKAGGRTGEGQV